MVKAEVKNMSCFLIISTYSLCGNAARNDGFVLMDPDQNLLAVVPPGAPFKLSFPIGPDTPVEDLHMYICDPVAEA